jgi:hypothetical protein
MNPELVTNAADQYNMVLLPGEKMITEISGPNKARCQRTTFQKNEDSTMFITFEKPGCDTVKYSYPPLKSLN